MSSDVQTVAKRKRVLRALDSDFPLLATRAAIEIDRLLGAEKTSLESVYLLAELLKNSKIEMSGVPTGSLFDPATLTVLNQAMSEAKLTENMIPVDEVIAKSLEIAGDLSNSAEQSTERSNLERLKKYCIALSDISASYRQSVFGEVAPHPYKA